MSDIVLSQGFSFKVCSECGISYALPERYSSARQADGAAWYCPNGHGQWIRETTEKQLRKQLEEKERQLQFAASREASAKADLQRAEKARKRLEKRVSNGVCPFPGCKRHFSNLHRHIETEHKGEVMPVELPAPIDRKLLQ